MRQLRALASTASQRTAVLRKTSGVMHTKLDLGDPGKWVFGDMKEYGRVLLTVREDLRELKQQRSTLQKVLREVDSNMLKGV